MARMPSAGGSDSASIGIKDRAETFTESDVTLRKSGTVVNAGSVALGESATATTESVLLDTTRTITGGNYAGHVFETGDRTITEVAASVGAENSGHEDARIKRVSDGTVVASKTGIGGQSTITFSGLSLNTNAEYRIGLVGSADWTADDTGYQDASPPYSSSLGDIVAGYTDGIGRKGDRCFAFTDLTFSADAQASGSVAVEWPVPNDIYAWDRATFVKTANDGSVDVFIEADDGSGWAEVAGPISRGDGIPADPSDRVRLRADLSRPSTGDVSPTLDAIYRRWVV